MKNFSKRYNIKIPHFISILYCNKMRVILIKGPLTQKILKLKLKLNINNEKKLIYVTETFFDSTIPENKKNSFKKKLRGYTLSIIKRAIHEVSSKIYKKLNFVGVGYKAFLVTINSLELIKFKLGYSHDIFIKVFNDTNIHLDKSNILFISGYNFQDVFKITSLIRNYKLPEPYKGKGIIYENEVIKLKEGKKV